MFFRKHRLVTDPEDWLTRTEGEGSGVNRIFMTLFGNEFVLYSRLFVLVPSDPSDPFLLIIDVSRTQSKQCLG